VGADAEATGLLRVRADTTQAVKSIDGVSSAWSRVGKTLDTVAVGLGKFNLALGGIEKAIGAVKAGIDVIRDVDAFHKLERAVPVKVFEQLDEVTGQLYKKQDLLRFATKALNSDFKFSTTQMGDLLGAATALSAQGYGPMEQISEKLVKSIAKNGEGLDEYGIILDKTKPKIDVTNEALAKLHGIAESGTISEESRTIAEVDRAFESMAMTLKEDVVPILVQIVGLVHDTITGWDDMLGGLERKQARAAQRKAEEELARVQSGAEFYSGIQEAQMAGNEADFVRARGFETMSDADYANAMTAGLGTPQRSAVRGGPGKSEKGKAIEVYVSNAAEIGERVIGAGPGTGFGASAWDTSELENLEARNDLLDRRVIAARERERKAANPLSGMNIGGESIYGGNAELARLGDPLRNIKDQLGDTTTAAGAAYATLAGGITAAVDAAISGSDSIGKAAAKASAQILKSLAIEATGRAVYEGALAIGSLAIGDARGASMHGLAAAKFAAAAAGLGVLSAGLNAAASSGSGASAGGASSAPGGGFASSRGGSSGGDGSQTIIVNFGDGFVGDHDKVVDFIARAVRTSERNGRSRPASSFSSGFSG
jgi:hypothetical protein